MEKHIKIGLIQLKAKSGDIGFNMDEANLLVKETVDLGARIVLLPELWAIGYGLEHPEEYSESFGGVITSFMCEQAKRHGVFIAGGYPERDNQGNCYDAAVLLNPQGEPILNHRKVHLYSSLGENKVWSSGDCFEVVKTDLGIIGILIGFDGDFSESWRFLACQGVELVLHPTEYESPCENYGWWKKLYEANALANAVWCASANIVGDTPDKATHFFGWSRIIDPLGKEIASAAYVKPGMNCHSEVLVADLPFADALNKGKKRNGCFLKERRPDVYRKFTI